MGDLRAAVVVTGDEVLAGRVGDRNGRHLAEWLVAAGVMVERVVVLGDDAAAITAEVRGLVGGGTDLVLTTGGLGVTHDDLTMRAVADAAGLPMAVDPAALAWVRARSAGVPNAARIAPEIREATDRKQATLPVGGTVIPPAGTAPGSIVPMGDALVVVLPGPPREVVAMWESARAMPPLARMLARAGGGPRTVLRLFGVIEAEVVGHLADAPGDPLADLRMGICARPGELEIVLTEDPARPGAAARFTDALRGRFGPALFSADGRGVVEVVSDALRGAGQTLAVAESCTGGMLGARITAPAGASDHFLGGVLSYADAVKRDLLGVPAGTLAAHGAVSEPVARAMAEGVRRVTGADWGLSITGIAGPGGGTADKPVGLVFIGRSGPAGTVVERHLFRSDRDLVRERSVVHALHLLRRGLTAG